MEAENVEPVKNEIAQYVAALPMVVTTQQESEQAQARVVEIRKENKRRTKWFTDEILCHSKKAKDEAAAAYKKQQMVLTDLLKPLVDWESATNKNINAFETERRRLAAIAQEKENRRAAAQRARDMAQGKDPSASRPAMMIPPVAKTTKSAAGAYTFKTEKVVVITNEALIPDDFWIKTLNKKMVDAALRGGMVVPGAHLDDVLSSSIRTAQ